MLGTQSIPMIEVKKSNIEGNGVFATQHISQGQVVCLFKGELYTFDEVVELVRSGKEDAFDVFAIDTDYFLDLEEVFRSCNHSCEPNTFFRGFNEMIALKDIAQGEEITFDYSTTMHYDRPRLLAAGFTPWCLTCLCGAQNCRGEINEFKTLPTSIKENYIKNKQLPDFMLRIYNTL